jgi:hypothetical protein
MKLNPHRAGKLSVAVIGSILNLSVLTAAATPVVDCNCLSNLPIYHVTNCIGIVPDLCTVATNCFSTNYVAGPGFCVQSPGPYTPVSPGTNTIILTVTDVNSNVSQCTVDFIVTAPPAILSVACPTNKTVPCGTFWNFDTPGATTTCCDPTINTVVLNVVSNGFCPKVLICAWNVSDNCGNNSNCTQTVTVVDTVPPTTQCSGINLVPNPGFDFYTNCPDQLNRLAFAYPWFDPSIATPDYYNSCSPVGNGVSTPLNSQGSQAPLSGGGYGGAIVYYPFSDPTNSYREYLEVPLLAPLQAGQLYRVAFNVSLADGSAWAIAEIGAYLSVGPVISNATFTVFNFTPQVENPSYNILSSSNSWTLVQGTFIAGGGEDHLTLGNFHGNASTTLAAGNGPFAQAYYYFDDVSVQAVCGPDCTNKFVQCGSPIIFDSPLAYDLCSGTNVTVNITSTVTNNLCPPSMTRSWLLTDLCGNSCTWTQTITAVDTNPPYVLCSGVNLASNAQFETYSSCPTAFAQINLAAPWFTPTGASPDYFNGCATPSSGVSAPFNSLGFQPAFSGQGYAGAVVCTSDNNDFANSYREYIEAPLSAPLIAGQPYLVSFRVNLGDICSNAIAEVSARLTAGPLVNFSIQTCLPGTPQIINPSANILSSTNNWMLVQGIFTASGGENYITLGNFLSDQNTTAISIPGGTLPYAYYFYDDVAVTPLCNWVTNKVIPCGHPVVFDTPYPFDSCSGTNITLAVSTVTNVLCPLGVTRTWTYTNACGNVKSFSQTITAVDNNPPYALCTNVNLASNGQFEAYSTCPSSLSQLNLAAPWFQPTLGTSDYYNACATPSSGASVPVNYFGIQNAFSGQGYGGANVYSYYGDFTTSSREYIEAPLTAPLVAGQPYLVSFRVSLADASAFAISEIGAQFTVGPLTDYTISSCLSGTPQIVNPSANILSSTNNWMLVQGTFVASGGENYITLGNFLGDQNTTAISINTNNSSYSYYYYDDVTVTPLCNWVTNKTVSCGSPIVFDTPYPFDPCSGTNVTFAVSTVTNTVCPFGLIRTWTYTNACGNVKSFSQTIGITASALAISCSCLAEFGATGLYTNSCAGIVPNLLKFTNCFSSCVPFIRTQSPPAGTIVGPGTHIITVSATDCLGNSNCCAVPFTVNSVSPTISCPRDIVRFTCASGAVVYYNPVAFGNVGPVVCSPPSGTFFPANASYLVTATASNACGQSVSCTFAVTVMRPPGRWSCLTIIGIGFPLNPVGTAIVSYPPPLPGGGLGVDIENLGSSGQGGVLTDIGPAEKVTFSTVFDFNAPSGASFSLGVPPDPGNGTAGETFLTVTKGCSPACGFYVTRPISDPQTSLRTIAIGSDGELFSSFLIPNSIAGTNDLVALTPAAGVTSAVVTVTLDLHTRELSLEFPQCTWTSDPARKGWDGLIYGNEPRGSTNKPNARVVITPTPNPALPSIPTLSLLASNLPTLAFDNPAVTTMGRKWGDGHVTLMKAYDDPSGLEFIAFDADGGVNTDLGNAATFNFRMTHFEDTSVTNQELTFTARGWPPGTTTNRPSPPPIYWRLAQSSDGTNINCSADFGNFGISNVTLQLWNGPTLVSEKLHVTAVLDSPLVTLNAYPGMMGSPGAGVLSLSSTNPFTVLSGLDCPPTDCVGTDLRIIPESSTTGAPPVAFGPLSIALSAGMDVLLSGLQTTPACVPLVLNVEKTASCISLTWAADGFHLLGAENVNGPWYDLGVNSPVQLPANHSARYFRLSCD